MILVSGESLIDMLPVEQDGKRLFLPVVGGSPYNVALALGRLAARVSYLCRLSTDPFGNLLGRTLEQSRVDISMCPRTEALSTLGFVIFEPGNPAPSYVFYTENTAGCALEPADIPAQLPAQLRYLHFGSFSLAAEPIGSALDKLLSLRTPEMLVSVDPNVRPFLIRDREAFIRRLDHFLSNANLIKLSEEDMHWLHPSFSPAQCCDHYLDRGAGLVVVTRGSQGAYAMNRHAVTEEPAEKVQVADTIGAGDTFQAALLSWLSNHGVGPANLPGLAAEDVRELIRFAGRAAAVTCSRAGCNPPWAHDLNEAGKASALES